MHNCLQPSPPGGVNVSLLKATLGGAEGSTWRTSWKQQNRGTYNGFVSCFMEPNGSENSHEESQMNQIIALNLISI